MCHGNGMVGKGPFFYHPRGWLQHQNSPKHKDSVVHEVQQHEADGEMFRRRQCEQLFSVGIEVAVRDEITPDRHKAKDHRVERADNLVRVMLTMDENLTVSLFAVRVRWVEKGYTQQVSCYDGDTV